MANDKYGEFGDSGRSEVSDGAVRARNRTVMLTPEITGQVRARLSRENESEERTPSVMGLPEPDGDFVSPRPQLGHTPEYDMEIGHEDMAAEPRYPERPSAANGFNPIARETHHIAPPVQDVEATSSLPPQRRETPVINLGPSEPENYENDYQPRRSSKPTPTRAHKPVFDDDEGTSEASGDDRIVWLKKTPVVGFLVSYDSDPNGQVFYIRSGRMIVSSEQPNGGNYLQLADETVSPMHAILRVTEDAQVQVLDNLSEYGTTIVKPSSGEEISLSGDKAMVAHGDVIRFGKRSFSVCLIGK